MWIAGDGQDLLQRLSQLEAQSQGAPLVSIVEGHTGPSWQGSFATPANDDAGESAGDWEML